MKIHLYLLAVCTFTMVIPVYPQRNKQKEIRILQAELEEVRKERDIIKDNLEHAENQLAFCQNERRLFLSKLDDMGGQMRINNNLRNHLDHLEKWSRALVMGYGPGIWKSDNYVRPVFDRSIDTISVDYVIKLLNQQHRSYKNPELILLEIEGRNVKLGVTDEMKLTTGMGTYGAQSFLETALYSLISLGTVDCVIWEFEEGDHAVPGEYCK